MKGKIFHLLVFILIVIGAFTLRNYQLVDRSPFDWDQNRDYGQVLDIHNGKLVVLGPIAKGVGGFYLGSLYYYLLYPAFYLMKGDLSSLPITSVIIDSLVSGLIYLLLYKKWGSAKAMITAVLYTFSWFAIEASHVSWNVALVPIWSLLTVVTFANFLDKPKSKTLYLLALLTGFSVHVHVTTIPVIPLLLVLHYKLLKFPLQTWIIAIFVGLIPTLPLILYDLMHSLSNIRQARALMMWQMSAKTPLMPVVTNALTKWGKSVEGLVYAKFANNLWLGIITMVVAVGALKAKSKLIYASGIITIIAFLLVLALHDLGFPEYYFATAYLPILILLVNLAFNVSRKMKLLGYPVLLAALAFIIYINLKTLFTPRDLAYQLGVKQRMVDSLVKLGQPLEISYNLVPGREGGFGYLVERSPIVISPESKYKAIITDNRDHGAYYEGELAKDLLIEGHLKTSLYYDVR